jgi:8-oxo-dGTP pyrophosphatase MutT (NUDIX family)
MTEDVPLRRAATVVLVRDGAAGIEALLLRRHSDLAFHGGAWVFPGGRIDDEDYDGAPSADDHERAALVAACREAQEEAGLALDRSSLVPFAHWTTPIGPPRRFATWFFIASADAGAVVATDGGEITEHRWFSPSDALAARAAGEIELPPPTFVSLTWLDGASSAAAAVEDARRREYVRFEPHLHRVDAGMVHLYVGDVAYDDLALLHDTGARHRLWTDATSWRYERSVSHP